MEDLLRELIAEVKGLREDLAVQVCAQWALTDEQKRTVVRPAPWDAPFHEYLNQWIEWAFLNPQRAQRLSSHSFPAAAPPAVPPPPAGH